MTKIITICSLFLLLSCAEKKVEPIEKYKGKGLIVVNRNYAAGLSNPNDTKLRVKSKDSVFFIYLTDFDAKNLKIGDTIK
jgi:hypothetical protein